MTGRYYDFDGEPITVEEWTALYDARFSEIALTPQAAARWRVGYDDLGEMSVSTVWIGLNLRCGDGPPLIFETLVQGGPLNGEIGRYSTAGAAAAGHARWVALCRAKQALR